MFEYESRPSREWSSYVKALLFVVLGLTYAVFLIAAGNRYGKPAWFLPGATLLIATAGCHLVVNRLRRGFVEVDGVVEDVKLLDELPPDYDEYEYEYEDEHDDGVRRDFRIRFELESGEAYTVEFVGFYRFEPGETVPMLYDPGSPELAFPAVAKDEQLYDTCRGLGCLTILALMGGCSASCVF